ncbi:MAG: Mur ligase family protein [Candidatus Pacebacteria bacterium]|nr:Mur ligase family protein [Candidatus Paceibacterota bacterium]
MKINELKEKKILILGFGREGQDTFFFLKKLFPEKEFGIADKNEIYFRDKNAKLFSGKDYLKTIKDYEVIIKSPGIPIHLSEIEKASKEGRITSQMEIFFENCPGKIIGITGTKGKSTTTSLIYKILKAGGLKAHLVGNIGKPVLSSLFGAKEKDVFVCELSSHQLYNLKKSPDIAVLLNVYPEHLDYYKNIEEYSFAKANIALYQKKGDYLVYGSKNKIVSEIAKKSKAKKIAVKGEYYDLDKASAKEVGKIFGIPEKIIKKEIKNFTPLAHRLERIGEYRGIIFYNDALATIPEATIGAIKFLGKKVETIMLGGFERNINFENLAKEVLRSRIKTVILFPTTGEKIWNEIILQSKGKNLPKNFSVENMRDAVRLAYLNTARGKICLLSTASSSFSIFRDFKEKGNLFKKYVKQFARQKFK